MDTKSTLAAVTLLLSDSRGVYIPRDFVEGFDLESWGLSADNTDVKECSDPDSEWYWEAWQQILDQAKYDNRDGTFHKLYQDGDLFALNVDKMSAEELANFEFDEELINERKRQELIDELTAHPLVTIHRNVYQGYDKPDSDEYLIELTGYSDYSGSLVEKSKLQCLTDDYDFISVKHYDYAGRQAMFYIEDLQDADVDKLQSFLETLNSLTDYPLISEDLHSQLEIEAQDESWESCYCCDVRSEVEKRLNLDELNISDEDLYQLVHQACDSTNTEWINECGESMYLDLDRIMPTLAELVQERLSVAN